MLKRFGSSIRANKARAVLLQMAQNKTTVLQYTYAFESYLAQLEHYNESFYLTKFIFGLRLVILIEVFVKRPATMLEAKEISEGLELTHTMVKIHQKFGNKKTTKIAQHRGTQERQSNSLYYSIQDRAEMETCREIKQKHKTDFFTVGYISS